MKAKYLAWIPLVGIGALGVYWLSRREHSEAQPEFDKVDEASKESFPASDAPSW